jgi:hypothetical protein
MLQAASEGWCGIRDQQIVMAAVTAASLVVVAWYYGAFDAIRVRVFGSVRNGSPPGGGSAPHGGDAAARLAAEPSLCRIVNTAGEEWSVGTAVLVLADGDRAYALTCWHNLELPSARIRAPFQVLDDVFLVRARGTGSIRRDVEEDPATTPVKLITAHSDEYDDFALLEIDRDHVTRLGLHPFGAVTTDLVEGARVWVVGFDDPNSTHGAVAYACKIASSIRTRNNGAGLQRFFDITFERASFGPGMSGAPVFYATPTGPVLVGLAQSVAKRATGGAVGHVTPISAILAKWPALATQARSITPSELATGPFRDAVVNDASPSQLVHRVVPKQQHRRRGWVGVVIGLAIWAASFAGYAGSCEPHLPETLNVLTEFKPSGWMAEGVGDTAQQKISWNPGVSTGCLSSTTPTCVRITYAPRDSSWGGMYLQNVNNNWGTEPGRRLSSHFFWRSDYRRVSFAAKAETTGAVEFKAGGIANPALPFRDHFDLSTGTVRLTPEWKRFEIDLTGQDLRSVIGGFAWIATRTANPRGLVFYIDSVVYLKR